MRYRYQIVKRRAAAGEAEAGQSITHADRMHPEPPRAPTGAGIAAGVDRDTHSHAAHAHDLHRGAGAVHAAGGGAGLPSHPLTLTDPPDAPQATTDGAGAQLPTHRAKRATAVQDAPQRVRHTPI